MKVKKEKLLDKLVKKDYNNELEEVLSTKAFDEEVKNLLLDILYKVETAYSDYAKVKINVISKEKYIQNIINIVKNNCNSIRFITSEESKKRGNKTIIVNKRKKEILCYPIERKLLYCLAKIEKNENIIRSPYQVLNRTLTNAINIGNNINTVEPFRDFNGFSWNIATEEIENFYYNLIYQDLIILVGNQFLEEWANQNKSMVDYVELFKSDLEGKYGKKIAKNIVELLKELSVLIEISIDDDFKKELQNKKQELNTKIEKINDKESYLEEICEIKKSLIKKIKDIDMAINNKDLLAKEYKKINSELPLEERIFSTRILAKKMIKERDETLNKIEEYNKLMNPKRYRQERDILQTEYKYASLVETENLDEKIYEDIISLQKEVLRCIKIKATNAVEKIDLLKVICEMRYFNLIPVSGEKDISKVNELSKVSTNTKKEILNKSYEIKLINPVFEDEKQNFDLFKHIFSLHIISLEDVNFKINKEKDDYYVQFFDEDVIDDKFKLNLKMEKNLKLKNIKKGKESLFK